MVNDKMTLLYLFLICHINDYLIISQLTQNSLYYCMNCKKIYISFHGVQKKVSFVVAFLQW